MKILHMGDLHLDSPFAGLDISRSQTRRRELRETFSSMMRYVRENGVDMVIISGDLFDGAFVTRETVTLLVREFASLACPVVIAPGNHDPYTEDSVWKKTEFPENVFIFKKTELEKLSFDELSLDVYGYAFTETFCNECIVSGSVEDRDRINILACHADTLSPISRYAPLPLAVIRAFGADFCALGHVHNTEAANEALGDMGAYCGCPEGRDFGECGVKGAILVTVENGKVEAEKLRFCKRIYECSSISVDSAQNTSDVDRAIDDFVKGRGYDETYLLRLTLTGSVAPDFMINTRALCENKRGLYHIEIEDATSPTLNSEALLSDLGIRGELYRALLPKLESENAQERSKAALGLKYALCALNGEDISDI